MRISREETLGRKQALTCMSPWGTGYTEDSRRWSADHEAAGTLSSMPRSLPRRSAATAGGDLDKKSPRAAKA